MTVEMVTLTKSNFADLTKQSSQNLSNKAKRYSPGDSFKTKINETLTIYSEFDEEGNVLISQKDYDILLSEQHSEIALKFAESDIEANIRAIKDELHEAAEELLKKANTFISADISKYKEIINLSLKKFEDQLKVKDSELLKMEGRHQKELERLQENQRNEIEKLKKSTEILENNYQESVNNIEKNYKREIFIYKNDATKARELLAERSDFTERTRKVVAISVHLKYIVAILIIISIFLTVIWFKENEVKTALTFKSDIEISDLKSKTDNSKSSSKQKIKKTYKKLSE